MHINGIKTTIQEMLLGNMVIPIIKIRKIIEPFDIRIDDLPSMLLAL